MINVQLTDLLDAYQFASGGGGFENMAYLDIETGAIYCTSSDMEPEEELPEDLETSDRYVVLPDAHDLDLGRPLALSFVERELPDDEEKAADCFRTKGAYGCFKQLLEKRGALEKWHAFEAQATEAALREWCLEYGVQLTDAPRA